MDAQHFGDIRRKGMERMVFFEARIVTQGLPPQHRIDLVCRCRRCLGALIAFEVKHNFVVHNGEIVNQHNNALGQLEPFVNAAQNNSVPSYIVHFLLHLRASGASPIAAAHVDSHLPWYKLFQAAPQWEENVNLDMLGEQLEPIVLRAYEGTVEVRVRVNERLPGQQ